MFLPTNYIHVYLPERKDAQCSLHGTQTGSGISSAAKNVIEVQMCLETINMIFKYYEKSALRTAGFKAIQVSEYVSLLTHWDY